MLPRHPARSTLIAAVLAAGVVSAWVLWLTRAPGPGLSPDTMSYLGAAQELAAGREPRVPFTYWSDDDSTARLRDYPPGFPLAIATAMRAGASLEQGGRAVMVASAAVTAIAVTLAVGSVAGPAFGAGAALALFVTPAFVETHSIVLSEPLYLACLSVLLALMAMDDPPVLLLGFVAAAGVMVRYVGLSLAGGVALYCLTEPRPVARRLARAATGALPALVAFIAWSRWAGGARSYGWKPGFLTTLAEGSGTVQTWLVPWLAPGVPRAVIALVILVALVVIVVRAGKGVQGRGLPRPVMRGVGLLALCFAGLMIFSRVYADGAIIFDNRLLSPLLLCAVVAIAAACGVLWKSWHARGRVVAALIALAWLAGNARLVSAQVRELNEDGWGYASRDWIGSDLAAWIRGPGRAYALFSDNVPATWSLARRPSRHLPEDTDDSTVAQLGELLTDMHGAIIAYDSSQAPDAPRGGVFAARLGLRELLRTDEATVYAGAGVARP